MANGNGSSWTGLGSGMGGGTYPSYVSVSALAVSGIDLYVGGGFTTAGGSAANYIAKWKREQLVGVRFGAERLCVCAGGVGQQRVCGGLLHDGGRQRGHQHCPMEWEQLVGARFGDERQRWVER